jgi:hypothetical protein
MSAKQRDGVLLVYSVLNLQMLEVGCRVAARPCSCASAPARILQQMRQMRQCKPHAADYGQQSGLRVVPHHKTSMFADTVRPKGCGHALAHGMALVTFAIQ